MRIVVLVFLFLATPIGAIFAFDVPDAPEYFVSDYAEFFTREETSHLEATIQDLYKNGNIEAGIVTVVSLDDERIESLSRRILESWNIGAGADGRGLLMLLSGAEKRMHIAVTEPLLDIITEARATWIMDHVMAPSFQEGEFGEGFEGAIEAVYQGVVLGVFPWENGVSSTANVVQAKEGGIISWVMLGTIFFIALVLYKRYVVASNRDAV